MLKRSLLCLLFVCVCTMAMSERIYEANGTVYVPVRYVMEWLGGTMTVNAQTDAVTLTWNGKTAILKPGVKTMIVAGNNVSLPAPMEKEDRIIYAPYQFAVLAFGIHTPEEAGLQWTGNLLLVNPKTERVLRLRVMHKADAFISPLHLDAANGLLTLATRRLAAGVNVNIPDSSGKTPLIYAAEGGHLEVVKLLIAQGADIHFHSPEGNALCVSLSGNPHLDVARLLLSKGVRPNIACLADAAGTGALDIVETILAKGVPVNPNNDTDPVPLVSAAKKGQVSVVEYLLTKGADPQAARRNGATALTAAAEGGSETTVALLLEHGANINELDKRKIDLLHSTGTISITYTDSRSTALMAAAAIGKIKVVQMLLEHGADASITSDTGMTALHYAALSIGNLMDTYHLHTKNYIQDTLNLILIQSVTHINQPTRDFTLTVQVREEAKIPLTKLVPLHLACIHGNNQLVEKLLVAGADVKATTGNGLTPLHLAVIVDSASICTQLLGKGADVNAKDVNGQTPLKLALAYGDSAKVIELLQARGGQE